MKIVFLNVWGEAMRDNLVGYIDEQIRDTDIFCFQEATDEVLEACKDVLSNYQELSDYKALSGEDTFPQSMFIKNGIEIISSGTLLADVVDCGLAIYAEVKTSDENILICNIHGTARPNDKQDSPGRLSQSKGVIEFFKDKTQPIIIGGDFNLNPDIESIKMFSQNGYRNLIDEFSIETTRNHLAWDRYPDNKMYYSDYIFLNQDIRLKSFSVTNNEVSDHLPLILEIEN